MPGESDADHYARLEAFAENFRSVFPRVDQFRRFTAYLFGLVAADKRKNVEVIAARSAGLIPAEADLVQALQHFITRSPWDAGRLFAAVREVLADRLADPAAVWVVHDAVLLKKGRHSVGVQRQFARSLGRKVNCQIGVVVSQHGPNGFYPLAARLYLPGGWLRDQAVHADRTVPEEHRTSATKAAIGLQLIDGLLAEGRSPGAKVLAAENGYATADELIGGLAGRGLAWGDDADGVVVETLTRFNALRGTLGLDHFEGRTWVGWHHHISLVFAAHAFLAAE